MNITFQGFNKLAVQRYNIGNSKTEIISLNCELINDKLGNDLDCFIELLPHSDVLKKNGNFNLKLWKYKENPLGPFKENIYNINNDKFPISQENFKLFQNIAEFLKRILNLSDTDLAENNIFDEKYLYDNFILNSQITSREQLQGLSSPKYIKDVASDMVKTVTEDIDDYLS